MNNTPSPVSLLGQYLLVSCYKDSGLYRKVSSYCANLSTQQAALDTARQAFLKETESTIFSFKDMQSIYQIASKIRHSPLPVQYFIFERAMILSRYEFFHKDPPEYLIHADDKSAERFYLLLQPLWDDTLKQLDALDIDLSTHLSNLIHSY